MVQLIKPNLSRIRRLASSLEAPAPPKMRRLGNSSSSSPKEKDMEKLINDAFKKHGLSTDEDDTRTTQQKRLDTLEERLTKSGLDVPESTSKGRQGLGGKLLNALGAPGGAVTTLVHDIVDGGGVTPWKSLKRGFTGKERKLGSDILKELGVENKAGKALGGFALDVALDPTSYIGVGLVKNVGTQATRQAARQALGSAGQKMSKKQLDNIIDRAVGPSSRGAQTVLDTRVKDVAQALGRPVQRVEVPNKGYSGFELSDVAPSLPKQYNLEVGIPFTGVRGNVANLTPAVNATKNVALNIPTSSVPGLSHLGKAAKTASKYTKQAFSTFGKLPNSISNLFRQRQMNINFGSKESIQTGIKISNLLGKSFKGNEYVNRQLAHRLENNIPMNQFMGKLPKNFTKEQKNNARDAYTLARKEIKKIADNELRHGVLSKDRVRDFYFPHLLSGDKEALSVARRQLSGIEGNRLRTTGTHQQERTMDSLKELEGFVHVFNREHPNLKDIKIDYNVGKVIAARKVASETLIQNKKLLENITGLGPNVARKMRSANDPIPAGYSKAPDNITKDLGDYVFKDDVATFLSEWSRISVPGEELNAFTNLYDGLLNLFKTSATATPGFHIRNFLGSLWNNWIMGVRDPLDYVKAGDLVTRGGIRKLAPNMDVLRDTTISLPNGNTLNGAEVLQQAQRYDILNAGWMGDLKSKTMEEIGQQSALKKTYRLAPVREFGEATEDIARLAGFMNQIQKHGDPYTAALNVKKHLFDYSELSKFEKKWMRRLVPFYTWSRKNIPLQLESLMTRPGMYTGLVHAQDEGAEYSGIDIEDMPEWVANSAMVPFGEDSEGYINYLNQYALPANDLFEVLRASDPGKFPQGLFKWGMQQTAPFVKGIPEYTLNKEFFSDRPIDEHAEMSGEGIGRNEILNYLFQQTGLPYNIYRSTTGETNPFKYPTDEPRPRDAFSARNLPPYSMKHPAGMLGMLGEYNPEYWLEQSHPYRYAQQLQGEIRKATRQGKDVYTKTEIDQSDELNIPLEQVRIIRNMLDEMEERKTKKNIEKIYRYGAASQ